jgi:Uma2 family endonuclease
MTALLKQRMSVDEFDAWAERQPARFELFKGVPVAMSPERIIHVNTKHRVARALDDAVANAGLACHMVADGVAVRIDGRNSYQPDALVYCGDALPDDAIAVPDPVIVVEVLSPGNALKDLRDKLQGYFRVASIQHYLVVDPDERLVIHHSRGGGDVVTTRIISEGNIALDPPGLDVPLAALFASPTAQKKL